MKRLFLQICICCYLFIPTTLCAQTDDLRNKNFNICISDSGHIVFFSRLKGTEWNTIPFATTGKYKGPILHLNDQPIVWQKYPDRKNIFFTENDSLICKLQYILNEKELLLNVSIKNKTARILHPEKISLKIGTDAYMSHFPEWNQKHFPTMLRCEKTHFWGYTMSPDGSILGVACPTPVASWSIDYIGHHRLGSYNIDLINAIPQPQRHPEGLTSLAQNEEKSWDIYLAPIDNLKEVKATLARLCEAPMIDATGYYSITDGEEAFIQVYNATKVHFSILSPSGKEVANNLTSGGQEGLFQFKPNTGEPGVYTLTATNRKQKISEAKIYVRNPWTWYLDKARMATVEAPPLPAPHAEWFYNTYTAYLAARYIPDASSDSITNQNFRQLLHTMYDIENLKPKIKLPDYIMQWYYSLIGMMVDVYQVTGDQADLQVASDMADLIIKKGQQPDGAFRNTHGTHYTCVIYVIKPLLELAEEEARLGKTNITWKNRSEQHRLSAERAAADLLHRLDNIETEGEQTFEDGMISCSALQLGFMGLNLPEGELRKQYAEATEYMLNKHRCLEVLQVPDCRMIGGTFRFWEAYHDLRITPNMMNTPHGWGSWKTYATYYAYLLTGKEEWLRQTMDAVGSAMQMIDLGTGKLRWAFVPNPYIQARSLTEEDPVIIGDGKYQDRLIGEQYVEMKRYWRKKQASDNDVHEHFKMMAEVALPNAFVLERQDGSLLTYNCKAIRKGGKLIIHPYEQVINAVHLNLSNPQTVCIEFHNQKIETLVQHGLHWVKSE